MLPTRFSCGSVVYRRVDPAIQILLIKQSANDESWGIPKGHMEHGETYVETAVRETREEAGIDIKIITQLPHVVITRKKYRKIVVPFLATQACDRQPSSDHEASEVVEAKWFDIKELPPLCLYQRPIFDAALLMLEMGNG
jgi:ADP-ribose pyrophosphatase YjhB (NUDIX family)